MLESLFIKNFVIVDELEVSFEKGFSVLTGETGAGKSILIDALSLCLGQRSDFNSIRKNQDKASIKMDLPAPVSPVKTENPFSKLISSSSTMTKFLINNDSSIF